MSKYWEPCPRCGSKKVQTIGKLYLFLILIGTGSCLFWVGFLFPPIWIVSGLLVLVSPIAFFQKKVNQCQECNYAWPAGEAAEHKQPIDDVEEVTGDRRGLTNISRKK